MSNHQHLSIERQPVRGANRLVRKRQPPRAKAPWERGFVRGGVIAALVGLALLVAGCDTSDSKYFRYGIGTDLYSADIVETTQYQDIYLTELCRQALPLLSTTESACLNSALGQNEWDLIVQAGLNDVDRRCDSYLAWLDDRRRTNNAVLKELGDITVASQAIMRVSGVSANPITLAGLAFGLATDTFTNINSRLLLEVDKTTVQTLVLRRRNDYRLQLQDVRVTNRPAVVHALRSYLTICTPFTIETDINSTVTVFQQVGSAGLDRKGPLVSPVTIAPSAPLRAAQTIAQPPRPPIHQPSVTLAPFFLETLSQEDVDRALNGLCVNKNTTSAANQVNLVADLIKIYQDAVGSPGGKLSKQDRETITKQVDCGVALNYFEKTTFANTANDQARRISANAVKSLVGFLNNSNAGGTLDAGATLTDARSKIALVRADPRVAKPRPPPFDKQVTFDLYDVLSALPPSGGSK
jgi:hypothetical protein